MKPIDGGVTAPAGFRAAGVHAGIKKKPEKKDCALVVSDYPASVAGMFTQNVMKSPPVYWNIDVCKRGSARAVFVNSGVANACTGERGFADVQKTAGLVASALAIDANDVAIASTGVIGVPLPMDKISDGVSACAAGLSREGHLDAAKAIMTTDTVAKERAVEVALRDGTVTIGAMAKGAGMVAPNMATMIAVLTTDASVAPEVLDGMLREAVTVSFNQISVDNDMSTSDTVLIVANGRSGGGPIVEGSDDFTVFSRALRELCQELAKDLVRDGEGATKLVEIRVEGTATDAEARQIARAVAHSQLCKTAFFGEDPNWGRIACAVGYAGVTFDPNDLSLRLDGVVLVEGGRPINYSEADAVGVMKQGAFTVGVSVGAGPGKAQFWTSDLGYEYVRINADYRS